MLKSLARDINIYLSHREAFLLANDNLSKQASLGERQFKMDRTQKHLLLTTESQRKGANFLQIPPLK